MLFEPQTVANLASNLLEAFPEEYEGYEELFRPKKLRKTHRFRKRRYINSIFQELGKDLTRRAYRMHADSFWVLLSILNPGLDSFRTKRNCHKGTRGGTGGVKNGIISNATRLSVAIRYFAGGRPEDIALVHGISHSEVFRSVWRVVNAVNDCDHAKLDSSFPKNHEAQKTVAKEFQSVSRAGFDNCVGAIDCMLIWLEQPSLASCKASGVGRIKFFCGRKKKYGLGLQAVCDAHGRFMNIFIGHPATTSDFLAFTTSPLYFLLKDKKDFLAPGLCLYGDNAYIATDYMATPFRNVRSGPKDDYNFYQSQVSVLLVVSAVLIICNPFSRPSSCRSESRLNALLECLSTDGESFVVPFQKTYLSRRFLHLSCALASCTTSVSVSVSGKE